ncbi:MAG: two pore domain potassium channel family protein [Chloroflexi bacterium]|nr:MAG: two pore domain potassium channel family protein [Chloroflexota bacterium]TME45468.1 MAG: two pore domain potassium channel family protein [Chloroflexota bacterium]
MPSWLEIMLGLVVILAVFYDLFESVILPRPAVRKIALVRRLLRAFWWMWRWIGNRMESQSRRESWLAVFAPLGVLSMFGVWALALILGYGLLIDGVRTEVHPVPQTFGTSLYFSATTLVPLSYGDFVPEGVPARLITIAESASGVVLAALVITLLFSLYESFQRREELVVQLDAFAGAPPNGMQILETAAQRGMHEQLIRTFEEWRAWAAAVLESHLAYPMLFWFRSSHDNEAWLNSFGAVMDAAVLVLSTVDDDSDGAARLMFTVGNHLVEDLSWFFRYEKVADPIVEKYEYDQARERLRAAGFHCRDMKAAWEKFAHLRSNYASQLNQLARNLSIVPAEWIGDRSYLPHRNRPGRRLR